MTVLAAQLRRAAGATAWVAAARLLGVAWRVLLVAQLGFHEFGRYAVIMAAAALLAAPLDAYFVVRTPRISEADFATDRSARWWLGAAVAALGAALTVPWLLVGLVVAKAGADVAFNAQLAQAIREGRPDRAYRVDGARQLCSVAGATGWLLLTPDPTIGQITAVYVLVSVAFALPGLRHAVRVRPAVLEHPARTRMNVAESVGATAYINGDVVVLGALAGAAAAGQYSFGVIVVWLVGLAAQNFVTTFHEPLRAASGDPAAGPRPWHTGLLSLAAAAGMLAVAAGLVVAGADQGLWLAFAVLAPVAATRVWSGVCATVLVIQRRDALRLALTGTGVALKAAALVALAGWGAPGAAVAFVVADVVVTAWAVRRVYGVRVGGGR